MLRSAGFVAVVCLSLYAGDDRVRLRPVPQTDQNVKTGPAVGQRIPKFDAVDQTGRRQNFKTLRGPHGLALLFVRSADW
jgi:hypothetical protein